MSQTITIKQIQNHPYSFSISDDDLCSNCASCQYVPGELSLCGVHFDTHEFPGEKDEDGYVESCDAHVTITKDLQNWVM
jgi:hypothetical protein